jgi:hypothetical protein
MAVMVDDGFVQGEGVVGFTRKVWQMIFMGCMPIPAI